MSQRLAKERLKTIGRPLGMAGRPIDHRGFPVPWFVTVKDDKGRWDFSKITMDRFNEAVRQDRCWVSGNQLGSFRSFVLGPMCIINRVAADPPCQRAIAIWSAQVCPFLTRPRAKRQKQEVIEDQRGIMVERNPGICAVYTVRMKVPAKAGLFHLPPPVDVQWFANGEPATRDQVVEAMAEGASLLRKMAIEEGPDALALLDRFIERAQPTIPGVIHE